MTHHITADRLVESATQAVTEELFRDFDNTLRILCDEMQSAVVQRSYTVSKSLLTTSSISTLRCHSDRCTKVSYPMQK